MYDREDIRSGSVVYSECFFGGALFHIIKSLDCLYQSLFSALVTSLFRLPLTEKSSVRGKFIFPGPNLK